MKMPLRILTAVAAYDGHDVSVLALNKALLDCGRPVEVIYLGFNMTGEQIASAAVQEDVHGVAVSSYNGGHLQFFPELLEQLKQKGGEGILVFGGGGGTILAEDAHQIEAAGVSRIYGTEWSLEEVARDLLESLATAETVRRGDDPQALVKRLDEPAVLARLLSRIEAGSRGTQPGPPRWLEDLVDVPANQASKVVIVTGDGGAGKSTLIDELVQRQLETFPQRRLAVLANDPTTARQGVAGAFLADRVRMNAVYDQRVLLRSLASGATYAPFSPALADMVRLLRAARFELILVETPGSGQTGLDFTSLQADLLLYVKTKEYGGALQLEKDQLLRDADLVVLNKVDLQGAEAAFQELQAFLAEQKLPGQLHGIVAKAHRDPGMDRLFAGLCQALGWPGPELAPAGDIFRLAKKSVLVPHRRRSYLAEIVDRVRDYDRWAEEQVQLARRDPQAQDRLDPHCARLLESWPQQWRELSRRAARRLEQEPEVETPNGLRLPRVALPDPADRGESLRFLLEEGLPGSFPFVTGIFAYRTRSSAETTRQFAGLRGPEETNQRLHFLSRGVARPRLSIAFDGITLYGADSDDDPGSRGKIGEGGVSIDSYEDMKLLLQGFHIPDISTSMTINGPAPVILAMYFVAAMEIEQQRLEKQRGAALDESELAGLRGELLGSLRGTVQADILKEVQAQNECIFQPDFAVKLLGDVQQWFTRNGVDKFYSLSVSGYHIGEAGAAPIQELAFTLANGFTYVENFLARGMAVNDFAPSLSFFFRVSHEAEWLAYGAACRKIWAIAMRDVYRGDERSQHFKFHTQTSGRALQAEEWDSLNPVRQAYHALLGLLANTNSLHVDSADEPMTTPGEKWVRQATMIPNYLREEAEGFVIQNLLSGSYAFRNLLRQVQGGVLAEFERLDQLGGVGPATELGYQRRVIAEQSARYEQQRRRGAKAGQGAPLRRIIGYNTHELPEGHPDKYPPVGEVVRPDPRDWERQLGRVREFKARHAEDGPVYLMRLKEVALADGNIFGELLETVRHATLGQITRTLAQVGGRYRKMV